MWRITGVMGREVTRNWQAMLHLQHDGQFRGSTGCNSFCCTCDLTGEGLSFRQAAATLMACPETLMRQDQQILAAIGQASRFDIAADGG